MAEAKRVLILTPSAKLASAFRAPADKLALSLIFGCGESSSELLLDFSTRDAALSVVAHAQREPFAGIVAIADETAPVAARAASMLGLPFHTPKAADACRDKRVLAGRLEGAGLSATADCAEVSGAEVIDVNCLMRQGSLRILGVRTGTGVLPVRTLEAAMMSQVPDALRRLVALLGLRHGPVRVRCLANSGKLRVRDVSCAYLPSEDEAPLRFAIPLVDQDVSYEELLLRNALDLDTSRVLLALP